MFNDDDAEEEDQVYQFEMQCSKIKRAKRMTLRQDKDGQFFMVLLLPQDKDDSFPHYLDDDSFGFDI